MTQNIDSNTNLSKMGTEAVPCCFSKDKLHLLHDDMRNTEDYLNISTVALNETNNCAVTTTKHNLRSNKNTQNQIDQNSSEAQTDFVTTSKHRIAIIRRSDWIRNARKFTGLGGRFFSCYVIH